MKDDQPRPRRPHYAGHRSRLKERFRSSGRKALADYELLELLLGYAIPRRDTKPIAKALLEKFVTIQAVLDAPLDQLEEVSGLGPHASTLIALFRAGVSRYLEPSPETAPVISGP